MSPPSGSDGDSDISSADALRRRVAELEARLGEAEETLDAIRSGEVDAVVVGHAQDRRVFTLESADRPYRRLVEEMREGALTLNADGVLLYCNHAFADLVGASASQVVGARLKQFVLESLEPLDRMFEAGGRTEIVLRTAGGERRSASLSLSPLPTDDGRLICGVVADLTQSRAHARDLADARQDLAVAVAVQAGEERYRGLFNSIDAGFCIVKLAFDETNRSIDYQIVEANPAFERQTGLVGAQGKWVSETAPDLERHWFDLYGNVALTGEPIRFENHAASLEDRWYDVYAYRVGRPDAHQVAILFNDISDRRRAEASVRELNATLEQRVAERTKERDRLWELSPDLLTVVSYDGRLLRINPSWTRVLGYDEERLLTRPYVEILHPDEIESIAVLLAEMKASERPVLLENRLLAADGTWRTFVWTLSPEPDGERLYGVGRDVTEEKMQAQALAERTAERDRMWNTSPDLMLVIDFQGVFRRVNPAWTTMLGYTAEELVDHHVNEFVVPDDHRATTEAYETAAKGGRPAIENRYQHKDGSIRWIAWVAVPVGDMTYATGRDITSEKRRQTELEAAQEALRQSQKMEAMGQLTGGVAHDFNNLLTPIIGSLDMLQRREIGGEREQRLINGALQSADRAKTLVQRLLAFARRQPLKATAVDLGELLDGMGELVASTSGPQINIVVNAPEDLAPACADPNQLEMAILNLAVNARDAMPGGGTLTLSARNARIEEGHRSGLAPGAYVGFSVADTGIGMDAATMKRAVEPFFSTKGVGKGTGLGLSMVHGLVSQLGGAMTLVSEPGLGTKVELWLPISAQPAKAAPGNAVPAPDASGAGLVLLVDDEAFVRTSTADMLSDLGYEVVEAASAGEALKLLEDGLKADLLLTDHLMPGMTGTELAREARTRWPDCPVLLISGFAEAEGVAPDLPRLTKPFRQAELAVMLASLG